MVRSYWKDSDSSEIPYVITVGAGLDSTTEMMRLSENLCFVLNVPKIEQLQTIGFELIQQRLCEISKAEALNPSQFRRPKEVEISEARKSADIVGLPICQASFGLMVDYDGVRKTDINRQAKLVTRKAHQFSM